MPTKNLSTDTESNKVHTSPFLQISALEDEQEMRVQVAKNRIEEEKIESEKSFVHAEKTQEELMRTKATEELKEYARTEPAAILQHAEKETEAASSAIRAHAEKQLPKVLSTIISPLLDGSLFHTVA